MAERDLDAALTALVEAALSRSAESAALPDVQARLVAHALAAGLRELLRAPLREALQAGYDLGWRAAEDAQRRASVAHTTAPTAPPSPAAQDPEPQPVPAIAASTPTRAAVALPEDAPGAAEKAHEVLLDVGPFPGFSAVNRFHAAVAAAPGVTGAEVVAFRDGRLSLRVQHPGGTALAETLRALALGPLRVMAADADHVELELDGCWPSTVGDKPAAQAGAPAPAKSPRGRV